MNKYISISLITCLMGSLLFLYFNEILIINLPKKAIQKAIIKNAHKKSINVYFWKNDKWNKETVDMLWSNIDLDQNIYQIINNWLVILDEERIINKKVNLQTTLHSESNLYLSFDNALFSEHFSTYNKLMIIESLLKTLRESTDIKNIYFLCHNEVMDDHHLDFSNPWPITGFLN